MSATVNVINGTGSASDTTIGAIFVPPVMPPGSVRGSVNVSLPSAVNALGFDASVGPVNRGIFTNFISETDSLGRPELLVTPAFTGVIADPGDPLLTGFTISSNSAGTGFFNASNISVPVRTSVPESSSINSLLVAVVTFGLGTVFFHKQKQRKLTIVVQE
ncbi:hypothetical protein F7734_58295 [Scytonema sp. UIC 10036]|uniref:hypothetical protein n=1 Tax=Scytonema sp. UIC 10036 TaxID=2304196 RepID=UPI0012DAA4A9|nr:hypothetical protein [Scytonema sp. UIC 10036]MUH01504.1 hypothetical protein [Scytonema sp. UIC 10036]